MKPIRATLAALAVIAALSCDGNLMAPLTGDIYVLESIAGVSLPAPYAPNPDFNGTIVADTFAFEHDGQGRRRTVYDGEEGAEEQPFHYVAEGESIAITFVCPPNALCIAGPHLIGTRTNASLVFTQSLVTRHPLVLRRLFPPD